MAKIRVTITTWFRNGRYRNNIVEIPMADEMLELLIKNNITRKSVARCLAKNQSADVEIIVGDSAVHGMMNIDSLNTQDDVWTIEKNEEE